MAIKIEGLTKFQLLMLMDSIETIMEDFNFNEDKQVELDAILKALEPQIIKECGSIDSIGTAICNIYETEGSWK